MQPQMIMQKVMFVASTTEGLDCGEGSAPPLLHLHCGSVYMQVIVSPFVILQLMNCAALGSRTG